MNDYADFLASKSLAPIATGFGHDAADLLRLPPYPDAGHGAAAKAAARAGGRQ